MPGEKQAAAPCLRQVGDDVAAVAPRRRPGRRCHARAPGCGVAGQGVGKTATVMPSPKQEPRRERRAGRLGRAPPSPHRARRVAPRRGRSAGRAPSGWRGRRCRGRAVVAGDPAALEAPVDDEALAARPAGLRHRLPAGPGRAARAAIGADVEDRQLAREKARHAASGSNGSHRRRGADAAPRPGDLGCAAPRGRARTSAAAALVDLRRRRAPRRRGRAARRRSVSTGIRPVVAWPGIERGARRVAVHVDDGARHRGMDQGRAEVAGEAIERVDPPIRVLQGDLARHEARHDLVRQLHCPYAAG